MCRTGLTLLDTIQNGIGSVRLMEEMPPRRTRGSGSLQHLIHGSGACALLFLDLLDACSTPDVDDVYRWSEENEFLQRKSSLIMEQYDSGDPLKKKVMSVFLESFLFYLGFCLPMFWSSRARLTNTPGVT